MLYCPKCNTSVTEETKKTEVLDTQNTIPWYDSSVGKRMKKPIESDKKNLNKENNYMIVIWIIYFLILIAILCLIIFYVI